MGQHIEALTQDLICSEVLAIVHRCKVNGKCQCNGTDMFIQICNFINCHRMSSKKEINLILKSKIGKIGLTGRKDKNENRGLRTYLENMEFFFHPICRQHQF